MVKRTSLAAVAVGLVFSLAVAGCQEGTVKQPSSSPSQPAADHNVQIPAKTIAKAAPSEVHRDTAWKDAKIQTFDAMLTDGRAWLPRAVTDDGMILAQVPKQEGKSTQTELVWFNPATGEHESVAVLPAGSYIAGLDVNEKWIVWSESTDINYLNWKMHVYDRQKKQDKVVATSLKGEDGNGFPGPIWQPDLQGDEFVWSPVIGMPTEKGVQVVVNKFNIVTGETTELSKTAGNPQMVNEGVWWIGRDDEINEGAVFRTQNGKTDKMTEKKVITYFTTDGSSFAWSGLQREGGEHWEVGLVDEKGNQRVLLKTPSHDGLQYLTMGSRILAWTAYQKVQVYDRKLDQIVTLEEKDAEYSQVMTTDKYLIWTTPIPQTEAERKAAKRQGIYPMKVNVLDLATLSN